MSFFENTRKPTGFGGKVIHKNKMGWLCVTGQKREE